MDTVKVGAKPSTKTILDTVDYLKLVPRTQLPLNPNISIAKVVTEPTRVLPLPIADDVRAMSCTYAPRDRMCRRGIRWAVGPSFAPTQAGTPILPGASIHFYPHTMHTAKEHFVADIINFVGLFGLRVDYRQNHFIKTDDPTKANEFVRRREGPSFLAGGVLTPNTVRAKSWLSLSPFFTGSVGWSTLPTGTRYTSSWGYGGYLQLGPLEILGETQSLFRGGNYDKYRVWNVGLLLPFPCTLMRECR